MSAEPSLADVLRSTPKPANSVMHADLASLRQLTLGTPLEIDLPSNVDRVRLASEIDFARLQPNWEIGYATMKSIPGPDAVAQATGGYVENVVNRDVVWTPNQMYLVPLPDRVLSIVRPADRKFLSQWLRKDRNASSSEFLAREAGKNLAPLSLLIAVDLEDVISPDNVAERLGDFTSLKGKDSGAVAKDLANLQGVALEVSRDTLTRTTITVTFREWPSALAPIAKEFFNELLQRRGSSIGDIQTWKLSSLEAQKQLQFTGSITPQVLDDVLGIFTVQRQTESIAHYEQQPKVPAQETSQSVVAENTREYFKKLVNIIHRVRDYSADNTGDRAQWNGNMANRIDDIPTLNVDSDMVQFGAEVGRALRTNMMSMQLTNIAVGAQAVANDAGTSGFTTATGFGTIAGARAGAYNSYYGGGAIGGNYYDPNSPMKYYRMSQAQGNTAFKQMMAQMEQAVSDMRRRMTEKYSIQF
jgi:hypothetical protein